MKTHRTIGLAAAALISLPSFVFGQNEGAPAAETPAALAVPEVPVDPAVMKTDASYALGIRTGQQFGQQFGRFGVKADDLDSASFLKGFLAGFKNDKPELPEQKLQAAMGAFGNNLQKREEEVAKTNLEAGDKFLAENGKREGVTTTASGLQYEVINKGGDKKYEAPKDGKEDNKQFMVNYRGTLIDGKEFDASPEGQTVPMTLQVVEGFKEALTTMPIGAKWKLFLPAKLAYGEQRRSAEIAPNSTLIFELELVSIEDAPPAPQGGMPFPMPEMGQ